MKKLFTPARLAAAVGVATGLGAAATSLAGALPVSHAQAAVVGAAGILGQAAVLFKFLEGQSKWETTTASIAANAAPSAPAALLEPEVAVLGDGDEPIVEDTPEPERLTAQL